MLNDVLHFTYFQQVEQRLSLLWFDFWLTDYCTNVYF